MHLVVAICTWNRCASLERTLSRLCEVRVPAGVTWECIVVNNNSSDRTDEVIAQFSDRLPLRRIWQPIQGLSNARNAAVDAAKADYIIWTDDDVVVSECWLETYAEAFRRWPDASVFGGPIKPVFEDSPPDWLVVRWADVADAYGNRDFGTECVPMDMRKGRTPYGANFALRMTEQRAHRYNPNLGLNGANRVLGEESAVVCAILGQGGSGWWLPKAEVGHWVPRSRLTIEHVGNYYRARGRASNRSSEHARRAMFGKPRWIWRVWLEHRIGYLRKRALGQPVDVWLVDWIESEAAWAHLTDRGR